MDCRSACHSACGKRHQDWDASYRWELLSLSSKYDSSAKSSHAPVVSTLHQIFRPSAVMVMEIGGYALSVKKHSLVKGKRAAQQLLKPKYLGIGTSRPKGTLPDAAARELGMETAEIIRFLDVENVGISVQFLLWHAVKLSTKFHAWNSGGGGCINCVLERHIRTTRSAEKNAPRIAASRLKAHTQADSMPVPIVSTWGPAAA